MIPSENYGTPTPCSDSVVPQSAWNVGDSVRVSFPDNMVKYSEVLVHPLNGQKGSVSCASINGCICTVIHVAYRSPTCAKFDTIDVRIDLGPLTGTVLPFMSSWLEPVASKDVVVPKGAEKPMELGEILDTASAEPTKVDPNTKYLRKFYPKDGKIHTDENGKQYILTDVYGVLKAFNVTCQAIGHAAKKLLCAGIRGKGDKAQDLYESKIAITRAVEMHYEDQK